MSNEYHTPLDVERAMIELGREIDKAPATIRDHHNKVRSARADFKIAYALAYSRAAGTQSDKRYEADLKTQEHAEALAIAEVEYRFVIDTFESLKTKLRALQSVASLMKAQMFSPQGGI